VASGGALPSLNDSNWRKESTLAAASLDQRMTKGREEKKKYYPLLVGKEVIISDPVSGGVDMAYDGSHAINIFFFLF
jgi:hypothetical protein